MKVLIVVTHLLGTGHLARALTLGRAFSAAGHKAVVASGGMPAPHLNSDGVTLNQLPPLRSDGTNFTTLLTERGLPASAEMLKTRISALISLANDLRPDILITELYPFGRRILADEFLALLKYVHSSSHRPVVLASIRDILAPPSKPAKAERSEAIIAKYYDGVLVHSDEASAPLDISWPVGEALRPKLHYTGYVAPPPAGPHSEYAGKDEILVSAGGGPVGAHLFRIALAAAQLHKDYNWRLLVGGQNAEAMIAELRPAAGSAPVTIEPARPDFRQMLYHATASLSMCGYNTTLDLLQAATPAVIVPFDDGNEVEQILRASALARLPGFEVIRSADLTAKTLFEALNKVIQDPRRDATNVSFDGADQSVAIACQIARARR